MISKTLTTLGLKTAFHYIEKDPEKNLPKLMEWVDRLAGTGPDSFEPQRDAFRAVINDPSNNMYRLIMNIFRDVDNDVLKATFQNFFLNANIIGWPIQEKFRAEYNCNIPWAILLDPTSACNLHCTGCWAAEYGNKLNLTFDEIDSIIQQGKALGVYMYIYTGGEPLVRKKDLIALCEKHSDCQFLTFTNATLIDEAFADDMLRVKNFIPAISLEGFEEATDGRRGEGVYEKVLRAMSILREKKLPFGISACYTSQNLDSISSDEFMDKLVEWGAKFIWYFHYMPVGNDAVPALLPSPRQREAMYRRVVRRELDRDGLLAAGTPEALLELAPQFETDSGGMVAVSVEAAVMEPMLVRRISGLADRQAAMDLLAGALGQRLPAMEVRPFGSELLLTPVRT